MNIRPRRLLALGMLAGAVGVLAVAAATSPIPEPSTTPDPVAVEPSPPTVTPAPTETAEPVTEPPAGTPHSEAPPVTEERIEFEDGSWRDPDGTTGCYDGAPCSLPTDYPHDTTPDVPDPANDLPDWRAIFEADGFIVGEVIVCPPPFEVAVDRYPDGTTWASCQ